MKKNPGTAGAGRPKIGDTRTVLPKSDEPTLEEIGVTPKESARAQKMATLPDETFQELKQGKITIKKAMTEIKEKTHKPIPKGNYV